MNVDLPILSIGEYIKVHKEKYGAWMTYNQVYRLIANDQVDHVKHDNRIYVVINHKAMEGLRTPKKSRIRIKKSRTDRAKWR